MASCSALGTPFCPSLPSLNLPTTRRTAVKPSLRFGKTITCQLEGSENDEEPKRKWNQLDVLRVCVTLTVVSAALPQPSVAAKVSERKRSKGSSQKRSAALTPEELKLWTKGLPVVTNRLPYTEILNLKRDGQLKHIIKPPGVGLRQRSEVVLAVLEDSSVSRIVLPSVETDRKFWASWDEMGIDSICVNAYTPPVKKPEIPSPYLGFLSRIPAWMLSFFKPKLQSKKALEAKRMREELKKSKNEELARMRAEREMVEKVIREQKKIEERERRKEMKKIKQEESLRQARRNYENMAAMWDNLASDTNVATALGKQRKDYEDRLKIEKAEAEERKKMRELEREMAGLEGTEDEEEEGKGEQNPYMKMAMQFMKSGARVRRAHNKRLPQYLERGVDVKFSDVAGLGKIRLELEEIVKFFTHGEMYRRRGVKIPGGILLCGPPGVGKTLLAKAVAGEAGVNFFSISASQFVEIYVGVGASRVRALYQEAKENAPSVVFIDELDAVGRERGLIKGSGGQERDATLNQLLVCLDGRFDRKIYIPKPGLIGRIEILKVHARKKPMAEDVDYMAVASITDGMVGAELANIIEIAAINMMRDGRTEITTDDLLQAAQIEERECLIERREARDVEASDYCSRAGRELGYVRAKMDRMKFKKGLLQFDYYVSFESLWYKCSCSRQSLLDHITVQLAPRAADELWYGEDQVETLLMILVCLSTIWAETADNARLAARTFVLGGLSENHYGLSILLVNECILVCTSCCERGPKFAEPAIHEIKI
ncbi:hypothetical protein NMG60_11002557 [Bertholletia excelsa]